MSHINQLSQAAVAAAASASKNRRKRNPGPSTSFADIEISEVDNSAHNDIAPQMKKAKEIDAQEEELLQEISKIEKPHGASSASKFKRGFFSNGVVIGTGINEDIDEVNKIINSVVHSNFEAMKQNRFMIGGIQNCITLKSKFLAAPIKRV